MVGMPIRKGGGVQLVDEVKEGNCTSLVAEPLTKNVAVQFYLPPAKSLFDFKGLDLHVTAVTPSWR